MCIRERFRHRGKIGKLRPLPRVKLYTYTGSSRMLCQGRRKGRQQPVSDFGAGDAAGAFAAGPRRAHGKSARRRRGAAVKCRRRGPGSFGGRGRFAYSLSRRSMIRYNCCLLYTSRRVVAYNDGFEKAFLDAYGIPSRGLRWGEDPICLLYTSRCV